MSEGTELQSYSYFAQNYELEEVREQLRIMQDNIKDLHDTIQAKHLQISNHSTDFLKQEPGSSNWQENRGFGAHNESNASECQKVDPSLG